MCSGERALGSALVFRLPRLYSRVCRTLLLEETNRGDTPSGHEVRPLPSRVKLYCTWQSSGTTASSEPRTWQTLSTQLHSILGPRYSVSSGHLTAGSSPALDSSTKMGPEAPSKLIAGQSGPGGLVGSSGRSFFTLRSAFARCAAASASAEALGLSFGSGAGGATCLAAARCCCGGSTLRVPQPCRQTAAPSASAAQAAALRGLGIARAPARPGRPTAA
mmetsp:Transcript_100275/g.323572  ORF Transcript_100275/g.323572 Transcript_100275/m.323572 type:complete len:219 (-) Transcript_100275:5-661(-)